jgi:uncharacterized protein (DUF1800 family)
MTVSTLNRRSFFQKLGKAMPHGAGEQGQAGEKPNPFRISDQELPLVPPPTTTISLSGGLEPYNGPWDVDQATHLLRRIGFGVKKADLDLLLGMTMDTAVEKVLGIGPNVPPYIPPPPPVYNYFDDTDPSNPYDYEEPNLQLGETWVTPAPADYDFNGDAEGYRIQSFRGWWLEQMVNQNASILEKLTLFWHNHFATQTASYFNGKGCYQHNNLLRSKALGNFKEMTKAVTLDPLMLIYLNGVYNTKWAPDENYARELQELFTIGKDNPDHYTEEDVVAAARVLTGWKIDYEKATMWYYAVDHDNTDKQFSAFYGNTVIPGNVNAEVELDALLDMIFEKNEVAEYLCRKLYRWFVYYHIDATTEANVIQPLAQIFRSGGYEILPVLETLLKSTHFFDAVNKGCYIKTPVDIVIGTLRSFNLGIPSQTYWDDFEMKYFLTDMLVGQQMVPGDPPNVAGWQAFRQVPLYYRMWVNSTTVRRRNEYLALLFSPYIATSDDNRLQIIPVDFAAQMSNPYDPVVMIDDMVKILLPQPLSDSKKWLLKNILLSGQSSDSYWTIAWSDYVNDPSNEMYYSIVNTRLTNMLAYMLLLPEYQLA